MKLTTISEVVWTLHFHHVRHNNGAWVTTVRLHLGPCERHLEHGMCHRPAFLGVARCSAKDIFCKALGRKLALQRAAHGMSRATREELWAAYWSICNPAKAVAHAK
jgi:hypothetical protein